MKRPGPMVHAVIFLAAVLFPAFSPAHGKGLLEEREAAWAAWQQATDAVWLKWRTEQLPEPVRQGIEADLERFPATLEAAGVLPKDDDHAWTEGCGRFEDTLVQATREIASPMGVESWAEWRAVHRVMCAPIEGEHALIQSTFSRLGQGMLPAPVSVSWTSLLLDELQQEDWQCMASQVPGALRKGLDRHEGLKWVARQCRLEPSLVFGDAQRCNRCTGHPRQPRQRTIQTWASRQLDPAPYHP